MSTASREGSAREVRMLDAEIRRLALPTLGALLAEPLFVLVDSAMVGHLGADALAGVSVASVWLQSIVMLMIFLAYSTTPRVARLLAAGEAGQAFRVGVSNLWLALGVGVLLVGALIPSVPALIGLFGATPDVAVLAQRYLEISLFGIPAMLLTYAAFGVFRGMRNTLVPLYLTVLAAVANAALNALCIYGLGMGVAGSALGTVVVQWGMASAAVLLLRSPIRAAAASWWPDVAEMRQSLHLGGWLLLRSLTQRGVYMLAVFAAGLYGATVLASYQILYVLMCFIAYGLDSIAIAAQTLVGRELGLLTRTLHDGALHDEAAPGRHLPPDAFAPLNLLARRCIRAGLLGALIVSAILLLSAPWIGRAFTADTAVLQQLPLGFAALCLAVLFGAVAWVGDGLLMGAGDVRFLGIVSVANLCSYALMLLLLQFLPWAAVAPVAWLTLALSIGFFGMRALATLLRLRRARWLRQGLRAVLATA